jgi:hypothetical protein
MMNGSVKYEHVGRYKKQVSIYPAAVKAVLEETQVAAG